MPVPRWRRAAIGTAITASAFAGVYLLLSKFAGFGHTWSEIRHANPVWLALGAALELLSLGGYMALFAGVVARGVARIGWWVSVQIPLAGIAALRVLATGGAGGFAVQAWALDRAGMPARTIASRLVTNVVIQYAVYLGALAVCGIGLWTRVLPGGGSFAVTLVPALFAVAVIAGVATLGVLPAAPERWLAAPARDPKWSRQARRWLVVAYSTVRMGVRSALALLARPRPWLLGALVYWGFDVAVLWCAFRAFGEAPAVPVVIAAYFVGTLADLLPFPGGIGGVDGGMIGVLLAFGVPSGRAVVAVLVYRAFSFWLPTLPGVASYFKLRATVRGWQRAARDVAATDAQPLAGPRISSIVEQ
ncbi:MAG: flippase-like domain-containing protein [Solirubrobacterales bacterium]|nr:flippase-like domain-containing protein [Solirubrobacterales bacterium]